MESWKTVKLLYFSSIIDSEKQNAKRGLNIVVINGGFLHNTMFLIT